MNATKRMSRRGTAVLVAATAAAGWCMAPTPANAGDFSIHVGMGSDRVWIEPTYRTVERVVTVPAVYETRPRQVCHEPVYRTRQVLVRIPAEVVTERVPVYRRGRVVSYRTVRRVVRPAREVWKTKQVLVQGGYCETVYDKVIVQAATRRVAHDRVLVQAGYWSTPRVLRPRPIHPVRRVIHPGPLRHAVRHPHRVAVRVGR